MSELLCAAFLFDMDGVLIDSTPAVARVWTHWARQRGFDPAEVVTRAHGRPSITTIREYLPKADHEAENRELERMEIEDIAGVVPLPGALELLNSLPRDRWAIVTSCTRALAEVRILAGGLPVPDLFLTSSDVTHGKPHPEPYLKAAAKLGFPATDCVVVEDVPAGISAGKAAGMRVIAFTTTAAREELEKSEPNWILRDCRDLSVEKRNGGLNVQIRKCCVPFAEDEQKKKARESN